MNAERIIGYARTFCRGSTFALAACLILAMAGPANASLLIGTFVESQAESIEKINQLIADYNDDFGTSLPLVHPLGFVDKIEGQDSASFIAGFYELSDFIFYEQMDGGTDRIVDIFDEENVEFEVSDLGLTAGFDTLDNPVQGFELSDSFDGFPFQYHVSKDGKLGWSLWLAMDGFNPAYTDLGTGASSIVGSGFTRGDITDSSLAYDPIKNAVSHISFYSIFAVAPEPSSLMLLFGGAASLVGFRLAGSRRRSRRLQRTDFDRR